MGDLFSSLGDALGSAATGAGSIIAALKGKGATGGTAAAQQSAAGSSSMTTYLLIGGGVLLAVVVLIVSLGRGK